MWLGLTLGFAIFCTLVLVLSPAHPTPAPCDGARDLPCLGADGRVALIDARGRLERLPLEDWQAQYADAQYDLVPPFAGPGPNAP